MKLLYLFSPQKTLNDESEIAKMIFNTVRFDCFVLHGHNYIAVFQGQGALLILQCATQ